MFSVDICGSFSALTRSDVAGGIGGSSDGWNALVAAGGHHAVIGPADNPAVRGGSIRIRREGHVGGGRLLLLLSLKLLQTLSQFGVSSRAGDGQRQAAQRVWDCQSSAVPFVQYHGCFEVTQSTGPHLQRRSRE